MDTVKSKESPVEAECLGMDLVYSDLIRVPQETLVHRSLF